MEKIKTIIYGSKGKMGRSLLESLKKENTLELLAAIGSSDSIDLPLPKADVVIDFTNTEATLLLLEKCLQLKKPLVIGTTGFTPEEESLIKTTSQKIPIVFSPNYSVGINTLFWLTKKATELLGPEYDTEIIELHHRFKKDAPSGTAWHLAKIIAEARHLNAEEEVAHGRAGMTDGRSPNEIGIHALRIGDVIGEHTVLFGTLGERLELTYRASTRAAYAVGALKAGFWLTSQPVGLYTMQDVLGLTMD
ncbi:MAG: 4-hydroxy-tetrahydrodipicolinate reductase [Chthoniobacterales bacterium]|nr:4-hydroxy-tetrahydrodipicolinate reductase [Chthoniobacterales bacterium]